jgi:phosphatidylinositol-bisphosphatase
MPSAAALRWEFIQSDLRSREAQFTRLREYTVWAGTWNVNSQEIGGSLSSWLRYDGAPPDFVFVGLQEMDRRPEAYVMTVSSKEATWNAFLLYSLQRTYGETEGYVMVASKSLVGTYAAMFARGAVVEAIKSVSTTTAACGLMGMIGNKGAAAIRVRIDNDHIVFVSSHLAAHAEYVTQRNQHYADLSRRLIFPPSTQLKSKPENAVEELLASWNEKSGPTTIWDCAVLIWGGDLNYRVDLPAMETRNLALSGQYSVLFERDQLRAEMAAGRAFGEFGEAFITFAPTFKYDVGSDSFDSRPTDPRAPAWTDRILFRKSDPVAILKYFSAMDLRLSDHKPVGCVLAASMRSINVDSFSAAYEATLRRVDLFENEAMPITAVSFNILNFGEVVYHRTFMMPVELLNTGSVVARYSFIPRLEGEQICSPWIHVQPRHGIVLPGRRKSSNIFTG